MTASINVRGHKTIWVWEDTREPVDDKRPCVRCGQHPTPEGHDACLGHIEGMSSACCGHGVEPPYVERQV